MRMVRANLFGIFLLVLSGCDAALRTDNSDLVTAHHTEQPFWVEELITGLDLPRSIAWLPNGDMLIAQWAGNILIVREGKVIGDLKGIPEVYLGQLDGLRDIKLDPDFADNHHIYLSFVDSKLDERTGKVFRATLEGDKLVDGKIIFKTQPSLPIGLGTPMHGMLFLPDKTLLVGVGSGPMEMLMRVQRMDNHLGKIIRINRDGSIPKDNPFLNTPDALPEIWALGLRNPAGMASMEDGSLWAIDNGPKGGDELNELKAGANYGWPLATWGFDYSGKAMATFTGSARQGGKGFAAPALVWSPVHTPSGLVQYRGEAYPFWDGDLFTGGLSGQSLRRIRIRDGKVILQERMLADLNERLRNIQLGPDNLLYILTDVHAQGRVLRLRPDVPPKGAHIAQSLFDTSAEKINHDKKEVVDPYQEKYGSLENYSYNSVNGERQFKQFCSACHRYGKFNTGYIGPDLNGINGRPSGEAPDFDYSASFTNPNRQVIWKHMSLLSFLDNPQAVFPGTKMSISPLPASAALDIVNYLTLSKDYGGNESDNYTNKAPIKHQ